MPKENYQKSAEDLLDKNEILLQKYIRKEDPVSWNNT